MRGREITGTRAAVTGCKEKIFFPWGQGTVGQAAQRGGAVSSCGSFMTHPDKSSEQPGQTSDMVLLRARGRTGDCWAAFQLELSYDLLFLQVGVAISNLMTFTFKFPIEFVQTLFLLRSVRSDSNVSWLFQPFFLWRKEKPHSLWCWCQYFK